LKSNCPSTGPAAHARGDPYVFRSRLQIVRLRAAVYVILSSDGPERLPLSRQ